jgi:hypothetical protein
MEPNRIEQRFGRVHRIGQTEVCHLWNLVAEDTREGQVFRRLFEKLDEQRKALGNQVFDVLGEAFRGRSLRDVLVEAVRYGEQPERRLYLNTVIDDTISQKLRQVIHERALVSDVMTAADVERIRDEMERAEIRKLQPHFIRSFFLTAFGHLGGSVREREPGRFEITHVPIELRRRDRQIGVGDPMLRRYERVTFEKGLIAAEGRARGRSGWPYRAIEPSESCGNRNRRYRDHRWNNSRDNIRHFQRRVCVTSKIKGSRAIYIRALFWCTIRIPPS